jgi:hypothetical protein
MTKPRDLKKHQSLQNHAKAVIENLLPFIKPGVTEKDIGLHA